MNTCFNLKKAAHTCNQGGVISYPTESVFGLGCDPENISAVEKILMIKQRPIDKGLILIASCIEQLRPYLSCSESELKTLSSKQNSPTTWLVNASALTPYWITGQHTKVAVRITEHNIARELCNLLGYPLVSTSANPASKAPAKNSLKSRIYFSGNVDCYISGETGKFKTPSKIIDLETSKIIRNS